MKRRVLVVEDDRAILELEFHVLRKLGHEVIAATDGLQGWEMARKELPDAILLDVTLPGCDGFSLARRLRIDPATRHIPIAMVTARQDDCGFSSGALMYLAKPFTTHAFQVVVFNLLGQQRRTPTMPSLGCAA